MKCLLIYPEFPETYWSFRHALAFEGKKAAFPPLGLLTISPMLPKAWERRLVDLNVGELDNADIAWADIVLISAMLVQKDSLVEVIARCKAFGKRVVVGGPYVSTTAEHLEGADHIFIGEAETTIPEFLKDLELGIAQPRYKAAERPSLHGTPIPDFRLADLTKYSSMSVQYSRGCPFNCEFCDIIEIYGRVPRTKTNSQILAELDALLDLGWRGMVFIVDDNFIGNKPNVKRLLPALSEWSEKHDFPFAFITEASVNLADDLELLGGMRSAGFRRVFLGIETPVIDSLKEAQKGQNTRGDLLDQVKAIQSFGMEVMAGFIVGFDSDPEDIFDRQIDFIRESGIPLAMVGLLNALPDTQLWRRLDKEGRLLNVSSGNNTSAELNFVPRMNPEVLIDGYKRIMKTIYCPTEYYQRVLKSLDRVDNSTVAPETMNMAGKLMAVFRIFLKLGLVDSARTDFWRFFRAAWKSHRRDIAEALRLAALGYHFRKLQLGGKV